jgi:hypothetical protein
MYYLEEIRPLKRYYLYISIVAVIINSKLTEHLELPHNLLFTHVIGDNQRN